MNRKKLQQRVIESLEENTGALVFALACAARRKALQDPTFEGRATRSVRYVANRFLATLPTNDLLGVYFRLRYQTSEDLQTAMHNLCNSKFIEDTRVEHAGGLVWL